MTVVALLVDPPAPGLALPGLADGTPLSEADAATLYAASARDAMRAVSGSGGDLLVNYRSADGLPDRHRSRADPEASARALARTAIGDLDGVRFEAQVGSSFSARAGNTATHLLREEGADSVAVIDGTAPFLSRTVVDGAAMKLRRADVVLGPADGGRVSFLGLTEPIDFTDAYDPPALVTIAERAVDDGLEVDFLDRLTVLRSEADLASVVAEVAARRTAGRIVPEHTAAAIEELGLGVEDVAGDPRIVRE